MLSPGRRRFSEGMAAALLLAWVPLHAQKSGRTYRIGVLRPTQAYEASNVRGGLLSRALREQGYVEGQNLQILERYANNKLDRLPALALELVAERVDLIFTVTSGATRAAMAATSTIPILFFGNFDPVAIGLVESLARPGGNTTGVLIAPDGTLAAKRMEWRGHTWRVCARLGRR